MMILADTNTFLAVALDEPEKPRLLEVTQGAQLVAPAVLPYEIGNALSALVKRGRLDAGEATAVWRVVQHIPVELVNVDVAASVRLAAEQDIYAYDAYFLQCAVQLKHPLLTLDRNMMRVAKALKIKLVEMS